MKNLRIVTLLIILVLVLTSWYFLRGRERLVSVKNQSSGVKVGVIAPLTGPLAEYGKAFKNGIILAQEEKMGSNVQFIFEDSAENPKLALSAFYKLRDQDKVSIIYDWGSATSQAIAPLIRDSNLLLLTASSEPAITNSSEYIVRTVYKSEDYGVAMWDYFRQKGYKNIGIVKLDVVFFNELLRGLEVAKRADESISIIDNYNSFGDRDFRTSIIKLTRQTKQVDAVGVFLVQGQVSQFYQQAGALSLKVPTFGTDVFESSSELTAAGKLMNGATYALNKFSPEFKKQYVERFGESGQLSYAANSFDIANYLMNSSYLNDRASFVSALRSTTNFTGVAGIYNYSSSAQDRVFSAPVVVKVINDGEASEVR